jgi:hypothetical protein
MTSFWSAVAEGADARGRFEESVEKVLARWEATDASKIPPQPLPNSGCNRCVNQPALQFHHVKNIQSVGLSDEIAHFVQDDSRSRESSAAMNNLFRVAITVDMH